MHVNILFITDIFLLCTLRTPWANYTAACPEKAWQCPKLCRGLVRTLPTLVLLSYSSLVSVMFFLMVFIYKTHVTITKFSN